MDAKSTFLHDMTEKHTPPSSPTSECHVFPSPNPHNADSEDNASSSSFASQFPIYNQLGDPEYTKFPSLNGLFAQIQTVRSSAPRCHSQDLDRKSTRLNSSHLGIS